MKTIFYLAIFFLNITSNLHAQEICNNGIDDDNNGLIDCLDNQCNCSPCTNKEGNLWYFGNKTGLDFNNNPPTVLSNSQMTHIEGCGSMADANGNLLFYTNGTTIWNRNHDVMNNGTGLTGHSSSTQSGFSIKAPGTDSLYYVFTPAPQESAGALNYSIINMKMDSSKGAVISKNIPLISPSATEQISAVQHCNNRDYWIIGHELFSSNFHVFLLSDTGLSAPIIQTIGTSSTTAHGSIKVNPDGNKIATGNWSAFEIYDFDNSTGILSNHIKLPYNTAYYTEFSPNGRFLYGGKNYGSTIYQFDLSLPSDTAMMDSAYIVKSINGNYQFGQIQAAPNGKIYIARFRGGSGSLYMPFINNPNGKGILCDYQHDSLYLDGNGIYEGLPQVFHAHLKPKEAPVLIAVDSICNTELNTVIQLSNPNNHCEPNAISWIYSGSNSFQSNDSSFTLTPTISGTETVILQSSNECPNLRDTVTFFIDNCLGIDDIENQTTIINAYPNPNSGRFILSSQNHAMNQLELYNLQGSIIFYHELDAPLFQYEMDISHLPKGVYYIKVFQDKQQVTIVKIVKN